MESIYIISTIKKAAKNIYKVGRHTGTNKSLDSRYTTPLQNPVTFYFKPVNQGTVCAIEKIIKKKLLPHRIINLNGSTLEWVNLELEKIITVITNVIEKFQKNKYNNMAKNIKATTKKTILVVYDNSSDTDNEYDKNLHHIKRKVNSSSGSNCESYDTEVSDLSTTEEARKNGIVDDYVKTTKKDKIKRAYDQNYSNDSSASNEYDLFEKEIFIIKTFINSLLKKTDEKNDQISISKLYKILRIWHKSDFKCPNKKALRVYIQTRTEKYVKKTDSICGYKIEEDDEDDDVRELDLHIC